MHSQLAVCRHLSLLPSERSKIYLYMRVEKEMEVGKASVLHEFPYMHMLAGRVRGRTYVQQESARRRVFGNHLIDVDVFLHLVIFAISHLQSPPLHLQFPLHLQTQIYWMYANATGTRNCPIPLPLTSISKFSTCSQGYRHAHAKKMLFLLALAVY